MPLSSEHSASNLYCGEDADGVVSWEADTWIPIEEDKRWIARLIDSELDYMPESDYLRRLRDRSIDPTTRQDAINWMLKVHDYYHFRPLTAYLSVNYFDRFLSSHTLPQQQRLNGWPLQLLSVTCLSLAAKIEETNVPLLIDLQVLEPRFVFEPRTIRRMELVVLGSLKWRMSSVTPFDFVDYFVSKLPCFDSHYNTLLSRVFSRASDLILQTSRVIDFLDFSPSTIAAAAVLLSAGENVDFQAGDDREMASFYEIVSEEMVRSCHQLMEQYLIDACPSSRLRHGRVESAPPLSPVGVLDAAACGSCDTQKSGSVNPEPSEAEPPNKRRKLAV